MPIGEDDVPKRETRGMTVAVNRRARYDYDLQDRFEAGLELLGTEIKSIRDRNVTISEGFARFQDGELWLYNVNIALYPPSIDNHEPGRTRKLLLHRRELDRLERDLRQNPRGTVVPLRLYLDRGLAKIEIALGYGRRSYDKRQVIAQRDSDRAIRRALRHEQR